MLSIAILKNADAVVAYFEKDNYYAKDDPQAQQYSQWFGRGAEQLNLEGNISKDDFVNLLEGYVGDKRLGRNVDGNWEHTPGWDLTFSAPKSYSILNQLTDNKDFHAAHDKAVQETLRYIEDHAAYVRITKHGKTQKLLQKNLTIAMFRHDTSRALDPNDHTHCVVANAVKTEDGWRSLDSKKFFDMKLQSGEFYRKQLARELTALGFEYEVTREKDFLFEISGVPPDLIKHHSQRREAILKQLAILGLDPANAKAAAIAALDTRQYKLDANREELKKEWKAISEQYNFNPGSVMANAVKTKRKLTRLNQDIDPAEKTLEVVSHVMAVLSERDASFKKEDFIDECVSCNIFRPSYDEVLYAIDAKINSGDLIEIGDDRQGFFTTKAGQELEKATIDQLYQGFEKLEPVCTDVDLKKLFPDVDFSEGQGDSLKLILETKDQFIGVQGYAGTGKTFMLKSATTIAEMNGFEVKGMAKSSSAAQILGNEIERETKNISQHIADHYKEQRMHKGVKIDNSKQLWFVDESSLASTKDLKTLMGIADKTDARVVFIGDTAQKDSVEAGRIFYQLQAAGMDTAIMADIKRQKDQELRKAVYSLVSLIGVNELKEIEQNRNVEVAKRDFKEFCEKVKPLVTEDQHKELIQISNKLNMAETAKERNLCLKNAISIVSDDVSKALENIEGRISEYQKTEERENALIDDFFLLSKEERAETIIIIPSNEGRNKINKKLREHFNTKGILQGNEIKINALVNRGLESERLKHTYAYRVNDVIRFGRDFRKNKKNYIKAGEYFRVLENNGELKLQKIKTINEEDKTITWKPKKTMRDRSVELYEEEERGLQVGDKIRWRKNLNDLEILNGEESTIKSIHDKVITTINAKGVKRDFDLSKIHFRHLDYAYTHTVDSAQGATFNRVMGMCESFRKNLINQKAFYVVLSRAKEHARLYTDKAKHLFNAILERHGANTVAIDAKEYAWTINKHLQKGQEKVIDKPVKTEKTVSTGIFL